MLWGGIIAYALGLAALTFAEMRDSDWTRALKPLMAAAFVGVGAISLLATGTPYAKLILAALLACAVGDALLLRRGTGPAFLAGMAAFGIGHLIYSAAFITLWEGTSAVQGWWLIAAVFLPLTTAWWMVRRTQPTPVAVGAMIYGVVIGGMLAFALGSGSWIVLPALAFAASDLFVAQNRFTTPKTWHPLAITPLYFAAQLAFALSPALLSA